MSTAFLAIGLVIALAAFLGAWSYYFRLPLILAYIVAGIIVGPFILNGVTNDIFLVLRDLGLSFLLFLVGLEIKTNELKQIGRQAAFTGFIQIIVTSSIGFLLALGLGFSFSASFYLSLALTFSSTVIVIKLLNEKRDYDSLYGKLTVAILLLQDVVAIFFLVILSGIKPSNIGFNFLHLLLPLITGTLLFGVIYLLNKKILPYIFERLARNTELLFLSSLAWLFIVVAAAGSFNFSLEIGAFIAGIGLASLKQEHQIASRVRPLRDFFLVIFFIVLGSHIVIDFNFSILFYAVIFSLFIILVKPLIILVAFGRFGFRRRTGFMTGLSLAQVSEFSLIIMFLGLKNGAIGQDIVGIVTLTAIITIATSSYLLVYASKIYRRVEKYLKIFEVKGAVGDHPNQEKLNDHVVLIGCDRLGSEILKQLQKQGKQVLVVDFNPSIINILKEANIEYLFGDITDPDIWEEAKINKASLVISTVFDPTDTQELLTNIKELDEKPLVFVTSAEREGAIRFYKMGANYVIVPRILSGHQVAHLLGREKLAEIKEGLIKNDHLQELRGDIV